MKKTNNIEDIYPLSPLQQGMLFHALYDPEAGLYHDQVIFDVTAPGGIDVEVFRRAWEENLRRHGALRTVFSWRRRDAPIQLVLRRVRLLFEAHDWAPSEPAAREERLRRYLEEDRKRGFDFSKAPLLRVALIRHAPEEYQCLLSYHHILMDAWSLSHVLRDFHELYESLRAGRPPSLGEARPYRDYVSWLRRQELDAAEAFWRRELAGVRSATSLHVDRVPQRDHLRGSGYRGATRQVSAAATAEVEGMARRHRLTLSSLLRGAWSLLLHRYSGGERDVVFGATVSGRPDDLPGVESMVGLFINTLPVRVRLGPAVPVLPWLGELQEQQLRIRRYEHSPLAEVQGWSEVRGRAPLFESILVFENVPWFQGPSQRLPQSARSGRLALGSVRYEPKSGYALSLMVTPGPGLALRALYPRDRFDDATIDRMLRHLTALLEGMPRAQDGRLRDLSMLTQAERQQALVQWQDTGRKGVGDTSIHQIFEAQARRRPHAAAVTTAESTLSFGALDAEANRLAHHLVSLGVGRGAPVAILLDRSPAMIVALLGILKAGAAYVPLDPTYPVERARWILRSIGVTCAVTSAALLETWERVLEEDFGLEHLVVADAEATEGTLRARGRSGGKARVSSARDLERRPTWSPAVTASAADLAYTIFTSGTTGTPKGVVVRHGPVINLIRWVNRTFDVGPADRILFVTSVSFDLSVYDVFGVLAAGGSVRVASNEEVREPAELARLLAQEPVTFWDSAPAALQQLIPFLPEDGLSTACLRLVFLSGDWVPTTLPARLGRVFPAARLVALGGATEATVWSNFHVVTAVDPRWRSIPYGRPIDNACYYVLDATLEPCPAGVPGDLFIGGQCLASGYASEPVLSARKFIPDPFGQRRGGRLYRTGDRSRFWPGGTLEFLGRLDQQVKIRGFRIELGEIENVLCRHEAVHEAVAVVVTDASEDKSLAACIVPSIGAVPEVPEIRRFLTRKLPDYMVPSTIVTMDALPVTANGKLDRASIQAELLTRSAAGRRRAGEPLRAPAEELLAGIWGEVLGLEGLGSEDDFFALGGHSLLATQVISRVRETFGIELPLRSLFEAPTLAKFAAEIEDARSTAHIPAIESEPIERFAPGTRMPLSHSQERMWFLHRVDANRLGYKIPALVRLEGSLDLAALHAAFDEASRRHHALRTTFVEDGDKVAQIVSSEWRSLLPVLDLTALAEPLRGRESQRRIRELLDLPFDLARAPLLRVCVLRLAPEEHAVVLSMHHIVSDAWSMAVLVAEIVRLYSSRIEGRPAPASDALVQYPDFARWQRRWLSHDVLEAQLAYWRRRLKTAPPILHLPGARGRPTRPTFRGAVAQIELSERLAASLRALSRQEGATLFMTMVAAFKVLLALYTGERDIAVGTNVANRRRRELEETIGYFANILVLRSDLTGDPSFREVLKRVREVALEAYAHQDVPYERVLEDLQGRRRAEGQGLFQAKFSFQDVPQPPTRVPGLVLRTIGTERVSANFDLTLFVSAAGRRLVVATEYSTDIYDRPAIERLHLHYRELMQKMVDDPTLRLSQLSLLSEAEEDTVLAGFCEAL
jgi:amino acid adenylation domain-containing protein